MTAPPLMKPQLPTPQDTTPPGSSSSTEAGSQDSRQQSLVVVDWNGPDDPEKPVNWPRSKKRAIISAVCLMRFTTPLASSMMAPALLQIKDEFSDTSQMLITFSVSIYVCFPSSKCNGLGCADFLDHRFRYWSSHPRSPVRNLRT